MFRTTDNLRTADMIHTADARKDKKMNVDEILRRVTAIHNTTVDVVRAEIEKTIHFGQRSPAFRETFGGREPTVDEYVQTMAEIIMKVRD